MYNIYIIYYIIYNIAVQATKTVQRPNHLLVLDINQMVVDRIPIALSKHRNNKPINPPVTRVTSPISWCFNPIDAKTQPIPYMYILSLVKSTTHKKLYIQWMMDSPSWLRSLWWKNQGSPIISRSVTTICSWMKSPLIGGGTLFPGKKNTFIQIGMIGFRSQPNQKPILFQELQSHSSPGFHTPWKSEKHDIPNWDPKWDGLYPCLSHPIISSFPDEFTQWFDALILHRPKSSKASCHCRRRPPEKSFKNRSFDMTHDHEQKPPLCWIGSWYDSYWGFTAWC